MDGPAPSGGTSRSRRMLASSAGGTRPSGELRGGKRPFRIGTVLCRIREAVRPLPKAAMFALAEEGHRTLFEQLVACVLSIRTRDEVSLVAARRLFAVAPTPAVLAALTPRRIDELVGDTTFHRACPVLDMCRQVGVEGHR